ncbi:MAG: hypothetical protein HOC10_00870, partial [Pelagibacteraceae bacterium]|nr:hypothetical protein [Pelagibacteraceae bacterium]
MAKKKIIKKKKSPLKKTITKKKIIKKGAAKKSVVSKKKTKVSKKKIPTKSKNLLKTKKVLKKKLITKKKKVVKKNKTISSKIKKKNKVIDTKPTKKQKKVILFDDHIKEVITKLLDKHKVDGIYTKKIIEKAVPKKFRIPENVSKVEVFLKKNNISILSEEAAVALIKAAKEDKSKSDDDSGEEEKKQTGKTDDPVRLYLRDMGAVELLSREGEIAIAKRIEAGRERMIGAICESPMTIRSIINWKESIKDGTMLLRDIVDLEASYDLSDIGENKI